MISDKLKEIYRLALEIKVDAEDAAASTNTLRVRRYYQGLLNEAHLNPIVGQCNDFERHVITRAEYYDALLKVEING